MKKYVFLASLGILLGCLAMGRWLAAAADFAAVFIWLALETRGRGRFRFFEGPGLSEASFELGADPAQLEIAADGSCAVFVTLDGAMSMRDAQGHELWKRPLERGFQAALPFQNGRCYYAIDDELVLTDEHGFVAARLAFAPPPFRQSYRLHLSADASTLLFHNPWFLQFAATDLSRLEDRIDSEACGHYLKYCALSPAGDRVFFAGAKLLEEEGSTQARWACWKKSGGAWAQSWSGAEESGSNSHLRGLAISRDGRALLLEIYHNGYEFRLFSPEGELTWRRTGGELPILSADASQLLFENAYDGVVFSDVATRQKLWSAKGDEKVRYKAVVSPGQSLVWRGGAMIRYRETGELAQKLTARNDPYRFCASADGLSMAVVHGQKGGMLRIQL